MYKRFGFIALVAVAISTVIAGSLIVRGSYLLTGHERGLRSWAHSHSVTRDAIDPQLKAEALARFSHYENLLYATHLEDGMVVNRSANGEMRDQCDSLLFSALRYIALVKVHEHIKAAEAWRAIERSQIDDEWHRHPRCRKKATSRDMIVGLIAALSQQPPRYQQHLRGLIDYIDARSGYVGNGPFYVSWLTPGVAEVIRQMADHLQVSTVHSPFINRGFSTAEFSLPFTKRGYETHLVAMSLWIELELTRATPPSRVAHGQQARNVLEQAKYLLNWFTHDDVAAQRQQWIAQTLFELDSDNQFFQLLRYRIGGVETVGVREKMLRALLAMPQFPADRLPQNCDRRADYLWQRDSNHYQRRAATCSVEYNGVDFMWLTALLLEPDMNSSEAIAH